MRKRRVAILYVRPLFGEGIAHLLQADERLEVTCLKADPAETTERLKRLRPHAIVMEGCGESPLLLEIVQDLPPTLFIAVHFRDNLLDIYHSRQVVAARLETLVEAIHHGRALRRREELSLQEG